MRRPSNRWAANLDRLEVHWLLNCTGKLPESVQGQSPKEGGKDG